MKVFALSEVTLAGIPRLATNLLKLLRNVSVDISSARSRCTARVTPQVYKHIHTSLDFSVPPCLCTYNGPAKSIPVCLNGWSSATLQCI